MGYMDKVRLEWRKFLGVVFGSYCTYCGKAMEEYGYNFYVRCPDPECDYYKEDK